ncbi:hypothetical protein ABPG75_012724 [Micractinium tetrahymenae]
MASTEPGAEELARGQRREGALERELREITSLSPSEEEEGEGSGVAAAEAGNEAAGEVRLQLGGHRLDDLARIEPLPEHRRVTMQINHVSAHVPLLMAQPSALGRLRGAVLRRKVGGDGSGKGGKPTHRQVLFDISGSVRPGEVMALMGPSGSGKTSLLSILGARAQKAMRVEGSCTFNGHPLTKPLKRRMGYVLQDDLLHSALTVYETLYYAALLRLPREMPRQDKLQRIEVVISALGLEHCRDTIIGGFMRKGISGGERKRCSIGVELLIDPSVILLDEPTSGLDASTSMHVLSTLRHLAGGGRSIIATLHQPSFRLYEQLDKLMLLSQGHLLYYGSAAAASDWFSAQGYTLPYRVSLPDFLLDLANGDVATDDRDGEHTRLFLIEQAEAFLSKHPLDGFQGLTEAGLAPKHRAMLAPHADDSARALGSNHSSGGGSDGLGLDGTEGPVATKAAVPSAASSGGLQPERRWGAPYSTQVALLFQRSLKTRRFESMSSQDIVQFVVIAILAGLFWLQAGQDYSLVGARNVLGLCFFLGVFLSFRALFNALFTFPEEYKHMLKERASGMYRLSAFFFARTLSDLPMSFALPTGFIIIVYFMAGMRYNAAAFFGVYGTCLLSILVAQSVGLLLGVATMNPKTAQTIASVVLMIMMLTGGFFVTNIPVWIGWLKYTSFIFYTLQILLFIEFDGGGRPVYSCTNPSSADTCAQVSPASPESNPSCSTVGDLQSALGLPQDPASQGEAYRNALILVAMLFGLRFITYIVLRRKTSRL